VNQQNVEETVTSRKANIKSPTLIWKNTIGVCHCHLSILGVLLLALPPTSFLQAGRRSARSFKKYWRCFLLCLRPPDNTIFQIHN